MRTMVFVFLLAVAMAAAYSQPKYTDKYDHANTDEILTNTRLLRAFYECIMGQGKCTPEGLEIKSHMKEALEENCAKCTDPQREGVRKVIAYLINNQKEWWTNLCNKYDPDRKYAHKYEKELQTVS